MAIAALANVGTSLRLTNALLQRVITPDMTADELATVGDMKLKGAEVIEALDVFGAGNAPLSEADPIFPSIDFMNQSGVAVLQAYERLDVVTKADLPDQFEHFEALRRRIKALEASVASATRR